MALIRISDVKPLNGFQVELTLTTGEVVQRDLRPFLNDPIFVSIREDEERFRQVRAEDELWCGRTAPTSAPTL